MVICMMDKLLKWRKNYMYPPQSDQTKHLWVAKFGWREGDFHALPLMTGFYNLFHNIPQKTQVVKIGFVPTVLADGGPLL